VLDDVLARLDATLPALTGRELPDALDDVDLGDRTASERFGLESALVDLIARRAGVPAWRSLGGGGVPVAINGYAGAAGDPSLVRNARGILDAGIGAVKVKVGGASFDLERSSLAQLRAELGDTFSLRLDANGAWSVEQARAYLASLASLDVSFVEQPVAGAELLRLGETEIPWAADESLLDPEVRARLLDDPEARRGCAAFVLKPCLLGGLRATLDLAAEARARRVGVVITHLFDGPVALAACRAVARALRTPPLACGLDVHAGLDAWPAASFPRGPWVTGDDGPGLGVEVPD
jgi:L-alanine-DL-glutamate epimerase-like enolase superfamily enzyme